MLIGGPALFLAGALAFELGALEKWSRTRFLALVATLLLWLLVPYVSSLTLSAAATAILVAVAAIEQVMVSRKRAAGGGSALASSPELPPESSV